MIVSEDAIDLERPTYSKLQGYISTQIGQAPTTTDMKLQKWVGGRRDIGAQASQGNSQVEDFADLPLGP